MNHTANKSFSFPVEDVESKNREQEKFELVSCPGSEVKCKKQLSEINLFYNDSEHYHREKDFQRSLESLQNAFYKTLELTDHPCSKCASFFRSSIIETVEVTHKELYKMAGGFFGNKRFAPGYLLSEKILNEFKKLETYHNFKLNENKQLYIQRIPQRKVS